MVIAKWLSEDSHHQEVMIMNPQPTYQDTRWILLLCKTYSWKRPKINKEWPVMANAFDLLTHLPLLPTAFLLDIVGLRPS